MDSYQAVLGALGIMMPVFLVMAIRGTGRRSAVTAAERQQMAALAETAQRMERRIESLEMLLDGEVPGWRSRSGVR